MAGKALLAGYHRHIVKCLIFKTSRPNKIVTILQTIFSIAFSLVRIVVFWFKSNSQQTSIGSDNGLIPNRRCAIIWTNDVLFNNAYMRHSASLELSLWSRTDKKCLNLMQFVVSQMSIRCVAQSITIVLKMLNNTYFHTGPHGLRGCMVNPVECPYQYQI